MTNKTYFKSSLALLFALSLIGWYFFLSEAGLTRYPFRFGLDLVGGTELVYRADTSRATDVNGAMESLKEVIERRINVFGVSEPLIQTESAGLISGNQDERLIVELPGVTDLESAKALIGQTPTLEFRLPRDNFQEILSGNPQVTLDEMFEPAELTGRYIERARVEFDPTTSLPSVGLELSKDGADLFAKITRENKGKILGIILDGQILSSPVIQDEIRDGRAQITGNFTAQEARELVRNLNYGALPVPIELLTSQTIGASLGEQALNASLYAGVVGFLSLSVFLIFWYRLPGLISVLALLLYVLLSLAVFKFIPVTLTAAGLAGFILSIGMAVDANVLIFERAKEELERGRSISEAFHEGFHRAWLSIRDSNIASIITAIVLFWLGTAAVKGFALTLGIGVAVSMFTAITLTRTFLFAITPATDTSVKKFIFSNGLSLFRNADLKIKN